MVLSGWTAATRPGSTGGACQGASRRTGAAPRSRVARRDGLLAGGRVVPEIRDGLPPSVSSTVPIADNAETIAKLYRRLVLLVGLQILLGILPAPGPGKLLPGGEPAWLRLRLVVLTVLGATAVTAYKLASHLEASAALAWAIAMFLPCINIFVLLVLSSKAQSWCQRYGIKVGLLGPTQQSVEELGQRILTSPFD